MKAALAGAVVSTAITMLALPRTAAADTYWTIVSLGLLPYAVFGVAARFTDRRWLWLSIVLYAIVDVTLRTVRLLGPEGLRNPLVVVSLPLLGAPGMVVLVSLAGVVWRAWKRSRATHQLP